jgi:hypothetical protein
MNQSPSHGSDFTNGSAGFAIYIGAMSIIALCTPSVGVLTAGGAANE